MDNDPAVLEDGEPAFRVIVLAGQRPGGPDPLAQRFGTSHRSLIPLAGRPLIAHVLQTAAAHPRVASLAVCIERAAFDPVWDVLTRLPGRGTVALVEAREDIAASVREAAAGWAGPLIITTADHALLSASAIDAIGAALGKADAAFALVPAERVAAAHHAAPCRPFRFSDGAYAACDVYGAAGPEALRAADVFRGAGELGRVQRIVRAAGLPGLLLIRLGLLSVDRAAERASRHLGLRLGVVMLDDGTQAIDVDDDRSYAVVRDLLGDGQRGEAPLPVEAARRAAG